MTYDPVYAKRWRLDREQGRTRIVPAARTVAHVRELLDDGWSVRGIAEIAGVSPSVVSRLARGEQTQVRRDIAARLLPLTREDRHARSNPAGFVPNIGARRRIEALLALGWRHSDITTAMSTTGTSSALVLHQIGDWIARTTHDAVAHAYDELSMTPGPSQRTRTRAARAGYAPPLAWDDDTIDNPDARPQHHTPTPNPTPGRRGVDLDEWLFLVRTGEHTTRAAERLGVTLNAIERAAARHGRDDVLDAIYPNRPRTKELAAS